MAGCVVLALGTMSPGQDMALVAKVTLRDGRGAAFRTTLGIMSGLPIHATASAIGLSAVLAASATAYTLIKFIGAAYLVFLGVQSIRRARRPSEPGVQRISISGRAAYAQGFVANVLNPKVALLYLTFLPQFVSPGRNLLESSLAFALVHALMGLVWLTFYAYLLDRVGRAFHERGFRQIIESIAGGALILVGVRVAVEQR